MAPFSSMLTDRVTLNKSNGEVIGNIVASVQKNKIFIDDGNLIIEEGDILSRTMSNGAIEEYEIIDRGFYEAWEGIEAHYQCDVRKLTSMRASVSTAKTINNYFNAPNTRYNENSSDNSVNIMIGTDTKLFDDIRTALKTHITDEERLLQILEQVNKMQSSVGTQSFKEKYARFIQSMGDHITIITPFLPMLSQYLIG